MADKLDYFKYRLYQYQEIKRRNAPFNLELPKQLLCMIADLLDQIANDLPDQLEWLTDMLILIGQVLRYICKTLVDSDLAYETR